MLNKKLREPVLFWLFLCFLCCSLTSCNNENQDRDTSNKTRLITLSPHLAELVSSAGALKSLVGVVSYSDFPEAVNDIQIVGDAFKLDYEQVSILRPDYILAWKNGTPQSIIDKLKSLDFNVIETEINTLEDIPKTIAQISELTNTQDSALANINIFKEALTKHKQINHPPLTIFIQTYHQPLYTVSGKHWMSQAAEICGYKNIFNDLFQLSATVSTESVLLKNPQTILSISNIKDEKWQDWKELDAVLNKKIHTISPDYFSRPSMRILQGIQQLCEFNK